MTTRNLRILILLILVFIIAPFVLFYLTVMMKAPKNIVVTVTPDSVSSLPAKTPENCADYIMVRNDTITICKKNVQKDVNTSNLEIEIASFLKEKSEGNITLFTRANTQYKYFKVILNILKKHNITKMELLTI